MKTKLSHPSPPPFAVARQRKKKKECVHLPYLLAKPKQKGKEEGICLGHSTILEVK